MMRRYLWCTITILSVCTSANAYDGFGRNTTGGIGGAVVAPATAEAFKAYVETIDTPYIVQVSGTLDLAPAGGKVSIRSNKTIMGIGENPTIIGQLGFKNKSSNVIIERLTVTCPQGYGEGDGISIKEDITNAVVTRCTIYNCYDGCVDITRRSDQITVSWCRFYFTVSENNARVTLVGNSDSATDDYGKLHITFHHNWYGPGCWQRIPSVRFGKAHIYNNFYDCPGNLYGVRSRIKAECRIENNYFKQINNPYYVYVAGEPPSDYGKIAASGNIRDNCTGQIHPGNDIVFVPPYDYTPDPAEWLPVIVPYGAGADGKEGMPPHWLFGSFGDYNLSGVVDSEDLPLLLEDWLSSENIENSDFNGDGIVNQDEFALLARHWLMLPTDLTPPAAPADVWALGQNGQVILSWAVNTEPDLAGYEVYRSTASGTDYVKLNQSLLTTTGYIDSNENISTLCYYIVRAVDTRGNVSAASLEGCARPTVGESELLLQENALGFCGVDGIVDLGKHPGFTGAGFCDTTNASDSGISWKINVTAAGAYTLTWRYANASVDRPGRLLVNTETAPPSISFPGTDDWGQWDAVTVGYSFTPGLYTLRLEAVGDEGLPNIDSLSLMGPGVEPVRCD